MLKQKSRATQVRVMTAGQRPLVTAEKVTIGFVSRLSVGVTLAGAGASTRHWKFVLAGTPTSTGGIVSSTVMTWRLVVMLKQKSRATQMWVITAGQRPLVTAEKVTIGFVS